MSKSDHRVINNEHALHGMSYFGFKTNDAQTSIVSMVDHFSFHELLNGITVACLTASCSLVPVFASNRSDRCQRRSYGGNQLDLCKSSHSRVMTPVGFIHFR